MIEHDQMELELSTGSDDKQEIFYSLPSSARSSYVDEISATNNSKVSELDIYQVAQQSASEAHNCAQELNTFIRRYNEVENVDLNHVSVYL